MKRLFLISKNSLNQISANKTKENQKIFENEFVILFEESSQIISPANLAVKDVITSAQIAQDFLNATNNNNEQKKVWANNLEKAKTISNNLDENFEIFLVYADKLINKNNLENKTLFIIEKNKQIDEIDCTKIDFTPPSPIIIEKILNKYPSYKIETINEEDENLFQINYYYKNIN